MHGIWRSSLLSVVLVSPLAWAESPLQSAPSNEWVVRGVFSAAVTDGGDDLAKVQFKNADSEKIKAGGLLMVGAGVLVAPSDSPFSYQVTLNYHFDSITAKNGDASFDRMPIEAQVFYNSGKHRFGAGLTHHLSPEVEFDFDDAPRETVEFDDATGAVIEYNYAVSPSIWLGLRYTTIDYSPSDVDGEDVDGDHVGVTLHIPFHF